MAGLIVIGFLVRSTKSTVEIGSDLSFSLGNNRIFKHGKPINTKRDNNYHYLVIEWMIDNNLQFHQEFRGSIGEKLDVIGLRNNNNLIEIE